VAGVDAVRVLVYALAPDHVFELLLAVEVGVVLGVDFLDHLHLRVEHLVLWVVDCFAERLVLFGLVGPILLLLVGVLDVVEVVGELLLVADEFVEFVFLLEVGDDQFSVLVHVTLDEVLLALHVVFIEDGAALFEFVQLADHVLHLDLFVEGEVPVHDQRVVLVEDVPLAFVLLALRLDQVGSQTAHPHALHLQFELFAAVGGFGVDLFVEYFPGAVLLVEVFAFDVLGHFVAEFLDLTLDEERLGLTLFLDALAQTLQHVLGDGVGLQIQFATLTLLLHLLAEHLDVAPDFGRLVGGVGVDQLGHVLHGDGIEVAVARLDLDLDLGVQVGDHVHVLAFVGLLLSEDVDEGADVWVFALLALEEADEVLEVLEVLLGLAELVVDAVRVVLEEFVGLGVVDQVGVDLLHLRDLGVDVAQVVLDVELLQTLLFALGRTRVGRVAEQLQDTVVQVLLLTLDELILVHGRKTEIYRLVFQRVQNRVFPQGKHLDLVVHHALLLEQKGTECGHVGDQVVHEDVVVFILRVIDEGVIGVDAFRPVGALHGHGVEVEPVVEGVVHFSFGLDRVDVHAERQHFVPGQPGLQGVGDLQNLRELEFLQVDAGQEFVLGFFGG